LCRNYIKKILKSQEVASYNLTLQQKEVFVRFLHIRLKKIQGLALKQFPQGQTLYFFPDTVQGLGLGVGAH